MYDCIWTEVHLFAVSGGDGEFGEVRDGAIAVRDGLIDWVGKAADLPDAPEQIAKRVRRGEGTWLGAGLVDCHTHLVFGGDRADEFERRLGGESYEAIARSGGGIRSTVRHTREASTDELLASAAQRALGLRDEGVTTLEVKSGYGLDLETELRMLRVGRSLSERISIPVRTTFLGAHAVPDEFQGRRAAYVDFLLEDVLPSVLDEGLADQVDAFLETIAFSADECRSVLGAAARAGLGLRLHADQLSDGEGARLAAELGAASADHLEYTSRVGARAMAAAGVVAVLLPGAYYSVGADQPPPVPTFRDVGVSMAVATDLNPGSSPVRSLLLAMNMACTLFGLTPAEAYRGATVHGARALGLSDRGRLAPGMRADLALWAVGHPRQLAYWIGGNPCMEVVSAGAPVFSLLQQGAS